jgi:hypothetical protein
MADLPPLAYGKVIGRFLANVSDGPDIDSLPEFPPLEGTVTFTAQTPKILVAEAAPDPATVVQLPEHYVATLDEDGYLTWRNQRGVRLIAPNGDTNPTGWTWRATFNFTYDGERVPFAAFSFPVPAYIPGPDPEDPDEDSTGLVDLTRVSPVPASNGEAVVRGLSVVDVSLTGDALVFELDNGTSLDPVTVPQLTVATDAATASAASATTAGAHAAAAQAALDGFSIEVGTVTEGPADVDIHGGPPGPWVADFVLPPGPAGPPAPDADATTKGILRIAGDLGGNAANPTVPGLAGKAPLVHGHAAADITDSTAVGRGVLTAATQSAARGAIGAGTSNLALGTTAGTACEGNDPRLSNARTPTAAGQVYDFEYVHTTGTRAAGAGNVLPQGIKLLRDITVTQVTWRGNTADASGNTVVELRKNGAQVSGTSKTIAAADQTAGGANATVTGSWNYDAGEILLPYTVSVGTTPGLYWVAEIKAVTR